LRGNSVLINIKYNLKIKKWLTDAIDVPTHTRVATFRWHARETVYGVQRQPSLMWLESSHNLSLSLGDACSVSILSLVLAIFFFIFLSFLSLS